jgi:hypothetical protein
LCGQRGLREVLPAELLAVLLGIEREPMRDTKAVGTQQQGKDEAMPTAAVVLLLMAVGLPRPLAGVAAGGGILGVLALLAVLGGVQDEDVQAAGGVPSGGAELFLGGGEQGGGGRGTAQPAEQPAGVADVGEDGTAAAATERRQVGRRKGMRKSRQQARSEALAEKSARKALQRGREEAKIRTTPGCGNLLLPFNVNGRPRYTQGIFVHL